MKTKALATLNSTALALFFLTAGCRDRPRTDENTNRVAAMDAVQDPGAHIVATSEGGVELLQLDPSIRRARFQTLVTESRHKCNGVVSAVLKASDNGTDIWRVACNNGVWLVTLGQSIPSVETCSTTQTPYCVDRLKPVEWQTPQLARGS